MAMTKRLDELEEDWMAFYHKQVENQKRRRLTYLGIVIVCVVAVVLIFIL